MRRTDTTEAHEAENESTADGSPSAVRRPSGNGTAPGGALVVPDDATRSEAAAITAAVHAHLAAERKAEAAEADRPAAACQWVLANRLRRVGRRASPLLGDAAADPWAANSRAMRR